MRVVAPTPGLEPQPVRDRERGRPRWPLRSGSPMAAVAASWAMNPSECTRNPPAAASRLTAALSVVQASASSSASPRAPSTARTTTVRVRRPSSPAPRASCRISARIAPACFASSFVASTRATQYLFGWPGQHPGGGRPCIVSRASESSRRPDRCRDRAPRGARRARDGALLRRRAVVAACARCDLRDRRRRFRHRRRSLVRRSLLQ